MIPERHLLELKGPSGLELECIHRQQLISELPFLAIDAIVLNVVSQGIQLYRWRKRCGARH